MTTTELIKLLQDNEKGGISHKPRNISLSINGRYMPDPQISLSSTGDGICGPEIDLDIEGEWFEQQPNRCNSCTHSEEQDGSNCYECVKGIADNFELQPTDVVSREAVEEITFQEPSYTDPYNILTEVREKVRALPSATPQIEPCEDCISREAVLEGLANIAKAKAKSDAQKSMMGRCMFFVEQLPPVTPQRQKGKWIEYKVDIASHPLHCSLCGFSNLHIGNRYMREFRRCPNCGAEMED